MTARQITYALKRIDKCKKAGCSLEALLHGYHLNISLIKHILSSTDSDFSSKGKKMKAVMHEFFDQIAANPQLKALINKNSLKAVKMWLSKMNDLFKKLKNNLPPDVQAMQSETEKIFGILNISANKLRINTKS